MAVRPLTVYAPTDRDHLNVRQGVWTELANGDTGAPFGEVSRADRSVDVEGTFGAAGNCRIEGRNFGQTEWKVLTDDKGNPLDVQEAGIYQVTEITDEIRPNVTAGDGTTDLSATITARGTRV